MIYGSICSGIEAASVAWHPLGWRPAFLSEIEAFPRAVLAHHYPDTPLHGDFTTIKADQYAAIDVLVGGTPCQSFSVAGLRAGLADERGNLALEFCRLARRLGPKWVVWENVPGVLSLDGGRAFASILGGLAECGYGLAYRVLDAQFVRVDGFGRAVPQRRRRVFVVGCLGGWQRAAAVLFERASMCGNPPPRRETGKGVAGSVKASSGSRGCDEAECNTIVARSVLAGGHSNNPLDENLVASTVNSKWAKGSGGYAGQNETENCCIVPAVEVANCLGAAPGSSRSHGEGQANYAIAVAHALRADGFDASEDGTGRGTPLVPIAFDKTQITSADNRCNPQPGDPCHPLVKGGRPPTLAFHARQDPDSGHVTHPLDTDVTSIGVLTGWRVRRLTPTECERLQGFPDGYSAVTYRGKPAADGPRYKALGNSMAVNVMCWIGTRIEMVEAIGGRKAP